MPSMFDQDSGLMRSLSSFVDIVWLNALMVVTALPVVTMGAALSAGYDTARAGIEGRGHLTRTYCASLRDNLAQSMALWLFMAAVGLTLAAAWLLDGGILIADAAVTALALVWAAVFSWIWPLQARFRNTVPVTLRNALVFALSRPLVTVGLLGVDLAYGAVAVGSLIYLPQGLFLLSLLGLGLPAYVHAFVMERALAPYTGVAPAA